MYLLLLCRVTDLYINDKLNYLKLDNKIQNS